MDAAQKFNEALIKLAIVMYRIDSRISLSEQEMADALADGMEWQSPISISAYQAQALAEVSRAMTLEQIEPLLLSLKDALQYDKQKALTVAQSLMDADGTRSAKEQQLFDFIKQQLLA